MSYEIHSKAPFKYTIYLYKYTYIITRLGMICKCGFCGIIKNGACRDCPFAVERLVPGMPGPEVQGGR